MQQRTGILYGCRIAFAMLILFPTVVHGATFYVRTDGNNANTGTANTADGAWRSINYGAGHVSAGDVVRVQAGMYVETASPAVSGTAGNTVTLVADGAVTTCGMLFSGKSYIRVIGFTMSPNASSCGGSPSPIVKLTGTNTGLEFWNNDIGNLAGHGMMNPNTMTDRCNKCIVLGGSVHDISNGSTGISLLGDDNFVGYVNIATICYIGVNPSGSRGRFVNLNFSSFIQCNGAHPDFFYINPAPTGFSNNVIESMYGIGTTTSIDNKTFHAQNESTSAWTDDIWRLNVTYNMGSGFYSMYDTTSALTRWRFYNNTHANCVMADDSDPYVESCGNISAQFGHGVSASIYNNIFYKAWAAASEVNHFNSGWAESSSPTVTKNYNLGYSPNGTIAFGPGWTAQVSHQDNVNPQFVSFGSDFSLQSGSNARGTGGPLTTTSGAGSTSASLTVAANTGSFFIGGNASNLPQYGGNLVPGDFITVGSTTVQVSSVSGDTLALASPISWSNGAPVYFGSSSTIDIGAYAYKPGGYALSANSTISGGTATITPNDASLVRFVICYSDSVPYAVANSSPYTCAVPAGTFSARVYPRYPSQTLWVTAGLSKIATPTYLRIVP